jgi:hypothetical protein
MIKAEIEINKMCECVFVIIFQTPSFEERVTPSLRQNLEPRQKELVKSKFKINQFPIQRLGLKLSFFFLFIFSPL